MLKNSFCHVTQWVFDLDNTLYPPEARLFDQIEVKMSAYVMASLGVDQTTADQLRRDYWRDYGTTLAGLMREHNVDPGPYLFDVHDIDLSHLNKDPALASAIGTLPGRKIVYTNGTAPYALTHPASLTNHCAADGNTLSCKNAKKQFLPCHAVGL